MASMRSDVVPPGPAGTGTIEKLGDMDMYVVGPPSASKAIVLVYDIMGMCVIGPPSGPR